MQVWREMPVRARHARAAKSAATPEVQDGTVSHLPQCRLLSVRTALPFRAQRRGGTQPQPCRARGVRARRSGSRPTDAAVAADVDVDGFGPGIADRIAVAVADQLDGELLPVVVVGAGQPEHVRLVVVIVGDAPSPSSAPSPHAASPSAAAAAIIQFSSFAATVADQ